jgi:arginine deiminase
MAAAAQAMGIDRLTVIDTGLDPLTTSRGQWGGGQLGGGQLGGGQWSGGRWGGGQPGGGRCDTGQWDDGGNALSLGRGLVVCDERNLETNARLTAAGIQVIPVPASELASGRGGPRCMSCAVTRDPAAQPSQPAGPRTLEGRATRPDLAVFPRRMPAVSDPHGLGADTQELVQIQ